MTAYDVCISDWSSDVFSSDLIIADRLLLAIGIADRQPRPAPLPPADRKAGPALDGARTRRIDRAGGVALDRNDAARRLDEQARLLVHRHDIAGDEIGRASCRERVCQYV